MTKSYKVTTIFEGIYLEVNIIGTVNQAALKLGLRSCFLDWLIAGGQNSQSKYNKITFSIGSADIDPISTIVNTYDHKCLYRTLAVYIECIGDLRTQMSVQNTHEVTQILK